MKKGILMISPFFSPNIGGVETHLDDLIVFLKDKYQIFVSTYQPLTSPQIKAAFRDKKKNLLIYRLPWLRGKYFYIFGKNSLLQFFYLFPGLFFLSLWLLLINFKKINTVHGHGLTALLMTVILGKLFGKKTVVSLHTIYKFQDNARLSRLVKPFLLATDKILILAKAGKDDLVNIGIPKEKINFYTNWVDTKKTFKPGNKTILREKLSLPKDKIIFLFVGRFSPEKGLRELLKTISFLRKRRDIFFLLVGDGPLEEEARLVKKKFPELIRLEGSARPDRLSDYYGAADFLIWASVDQDYFGRAAMGALSCGLPILVPTKTAYFGKWSKVEIKLPDGEIGYWIDPVPQKTAERVKEILDEIKIPGKLKELERRARAYAQKEFSDKNAHVFLSAYKGGKIVQC